MKPIIIDFETRSLADLKKIGGRLYAQHPTTEVVCAVALHDDETIIITDGPCPDRLAKLIHAGHPVLAHNANSFDRFDGQKLEWPEPVRWIDSARLARAHHLPGALEALAQRLYDRGKDLEGRALTLSLSKPDEEGNLPAITPEILQRVIDYCVADVQLTAMIVRDHLNTDYARSDIELDHRINDRGFPFDAQLARKIIESCQTLRDQAVESSGTTLDVLRSGPQLLELLATHGLILPDVTKKTLIHAQSRGDLAPEARALLQSRAAVANITESKLLSALERVSPDGRMRDTLQFFGAHTGRWSGHGFQPHNLPVPSLNIEELDTARSACLAGELLPREALSSLIRTCICAPEGKTLAIIDYASIEARVLAYLADEQATLDVFRRGIDVYAEMARKVIFKPAGDITKADRNFGKAMVLGCGYGMGASTFKAYAESYGVDWSEIEVTPEDAVNAWRDENPYVAGERTGKLFKGFVCRRGGLWKQLEYNLADTLYYNELPVIPLISGRSLYYRDLHRKTNAEGRVNLFYCNPHGSDVPTWGGKLCENVVQATARDIMLYHMHQIDAAGYEIVLHVHDEIIIEVDETDDTALKSISQIMQTPPSWAPGLPLAVEGFISKFYRK